MSGGLFAKRKIVVISVVAAMLLSLAGCGDGDSSGVKTVETQAVKSDMYEVKLNYQGVVKAKETKNYSFMSGGQYGKFKMVLLLFSSVPLGAVAGMMALRVFGQEISFFAMLGILSMLGIVLANAIVLVDFINAERKRGTSVDDACRIAGEKRLRPILMSTMTTVSVMLTAAMSLTAAAEQTTHQSAANGAECFDIQAATEYMMKNSLDLQEQSDSVATAKARCLISIIKRRN